MKSRGFYFYFAFNHNFKPPTTIQSNNLCAFSSGELAKIATEISNQCSPLHKYYVKRKFLGGNPLWNITSQVNNRLLHCMFYPIKLTWKLLILLHFFLYNKTNDTNV